VKPREDITISLPDGKKIPGKSWETTPASIALSIAKSLLENTVIAEVDGELWDLDRPLEKSCSLKLVDFEQPNGEISE
jgi:threonyl-tRNA synthetase